MNNKPKPATSHPGKQANGSAPIRKGTGPHPKGDENVEAVNTDDALEADEQVPDTPGPHTDQSTGGMAYNPPIHGDRDTQRDL
ncbi:MAG: hypothetical protein ABI432_04600 [Flavobacteriales bacterium]